MIERTNISKEVAQSLKRAVKVLARDKYVEEPVILLERFWRGAANPIEYEIYTIPKGLNLTSGNAVTGSTLLRLLESPKGTEIRVDYVEIVFSRRDERDWEASAKLEGMHAKRQLTLISHSDGTFEVRDPEISKQITEKMVQNWNSGNRGGDRFSPLRGNEIYVKN